MNFNMFILYKYEDISEKFYRMIDKYENIIGRKVGMKGSFVVWNISMKILVRSFIVLKLSICINKEIDVIVLFILLLLNFLLEILSIFRYI